MSTDLYEEAIVDVVGPDTMLSEPFVVKVRGVPLPAQILLPC